jgi:hypothetical protein
MREEDDGLPEIGESLATLGIRPKDIDVDEDGNVIPRTGGLSVTPNSIQNMPKFLKPRALGGEGRRPVFELQTASLDDALCARWVAADHAFVEPSFSYPFPTYVSNIHATRPNWVKVHE